MEQLTVEEWRQHILAGWAKWGNGEPLDPHTVEHLAVEFAKPMLPIVAPEPIVDYFAPLRGCAPWTGLGSVFMRDSVLYEDTSKIPQPRPPMEPCK